MSWKKVHPQAQLGMMGFVPVIILEDDKRPVREQIEERYAHGGGWQPVRGFKLLENGDLSYPGDPPFPVLYELQLRKEKVRFHLYAFLSVEQENGDFDVIRID